MNRRESDVTRDHLDALMASAVNIVRRRRESQLSRSLAERSASSISGNPYVSADVWGFGDTVSVRT